MALFFVSRMKLTATRYAHVFRPRRPLAMGGCSIAAKFSIEKEVRGLGYPPGHADSSRHAG